MRTTGRRLAAVAIGATFAALAVGRPPAPLAAPAPAPAPGRAPAPAPAPVLHVGRLTLRGCDIGRQGDSGLATLAAYCAAFAVPEDWQAPYGRRILLKVAILPAETSAPDPDMVTFLDGGPGGAASEDYPEVAASFEPLRERHAILLIDQRGTGGSNALDCPQLQGSQVQGSQVQGSQLQGPRQGAGSSAEQLTRLDSVSGLTQALRACLEQLRSRAAPQFYTTTAAVHDLEAVREALGDPPLDLIGISYGTRVAQQYAARYREAVRSVVLDSPVPNRLALLSEHAQNLERALRLTFAQCRASSPCRSRFGDPYRTLYRVRDRLLSHPQTVQLRDPVSFEPLHLALSADDLAAVVRFYAYSPLTAALLPLMLQQADGGDYAALLGQKKWLTDDLGGEITSGVELSVLCAEDADLLSPRSEDADTLLGNGPILRARAACSIWPHGERPADFHQPLRSALPVLVLSGELDPVTPPAYGREIVANLTHARLLIARGEGHGVIGAGCVPRLVAHFVASLDPAGLDARCLQRLGETPAFLNFNGAGP